MLGMSESPTAEPGKISSTQMKVVVAACFGTFLEWYDFLTFASLATYFSVLFFPPDNPTAALLASLATFGVGMLVRPIGAAVFGSLGDKYGRRPIFITTIFLMGITTFSVGLLPTYANVGMLAPVLLLVLRLLQGFAVGGEIGGAAVYLTEHAPKNRRGFYTSVLQLMGPMGIIASTVQVVALQYWLAGCGGLGEQRRLCAVQPVDDALAAELLALGFAPQAAFLDLAGHVDALVGRFGSEGFDQFARRRGRRFSDPPYF